MRVAQQRDLHLGGTGVALDGGVLGDDLLLGLCVSTDRHVELPIFLSRCAARRGLFTRALWIRGRLHGGCRHNWQPGKAISGGRRTRIGAWRPLRRPEAAGRTRSWRSLTVWLPSAWVVTRAAVVRRRAFSCTAVSTSTITPPSTRIHPRVWMSMPEHRRVAPRARGSARSPAVQFRVRTPSSTPPGPGRPDGDHLTAG